MTNPIPIISICPDHLKVESHCGITGQNHVRAIVGSAKLMLPDVKKEEVNPFASKYAANRNQKTSTSRWPTNKRRDVSWDARAGNLPKLRGDVLRSGRPLPFFFFCDVFLFSSASLPSLRRMFHEPTPISSSMMIIRGWRGHSKVRQGRTSGWQLAKGPFSCGTS